MSSLLRIGLAGLGTVGCGLLRLVQTQDSLRLGGRVEIIGVSARQRSRQRAVNISAYDWFDDPVALAQHPDLDLLVELIGGIDGPARASVETALGRGKSVVTANKALIAEKGLELARIAEEQRASLLFEAAVAGAIPIIGAVRESLSGTRLTRISGILNGTCNYILTRMRQSGQSYAECLGEAQSLGYAEADPYLDVSGTDSAHKIAILASIGFGARPGLEHVAITGIEAITPSDIALAEMMGFRIRLIAQALMDDGGVACRVEPVLVGGSHPLFAVEDALNAVVVDTKDAGALSFTGAGAGAEPTASAVMGDIASLFHGTGDRPYGLSARQLTRPWLPPGKDRQQAAWFIRLHLADKSGTMAALSRSLASVDVSIDALHQDFAGESGAAPIVLVTHECTRAAAEAALAHIVSLSACIGTPCLLRLDV